MTEKEHLATAPETGVAMETPGREPSPQPREEAPVPEPSPRPREEASAPEPSPRPGGEASASEPSPRPGGEASAPEPSPRPGGEASAPEPSPQSGEEAPAPEPSPRPGGEAPAPEPSPRPGGEALAPEPSPRPGEEAPAPEPSPQSGEEAPASEPSPQSGEEAPTSEPFPELPAQLGKYALNSVLGQGSFGTVYQAADQLTDRKVAVKVLHHNTAQQSAEARDERRQSFFNEAHAAVMMRHPNILQVLDAGVEKEHCYIVTELVENARTLQEYTSAERLLPVLQVVRIIYQCAAALDHIHGREVIHRDIKPENILMFPSGEVKIGDFGVAHVLHGDGETAPEEILGSPRYMAPEQLSGGKISYRTDFYSLGIIAYELLTGQHPFPAKNLQELCRKHQQAPLALTRYRLDLPPVLQLVIDRTLNQDPESRYGTGQEIAQDLCKAFKNLGEFNTGPKLEELLDALQETPFFAEFDPPEIKEVTEICICEEYKPGEKIICEGTINDSFYILISGNMAISKEGVAVDRLEKGACFGEMGYLEGIKRTATVTAGDHSRLVKINANLAARLSPEVQIKFSQAFIRVLVSRLRQTTAMLISK